MKIVFFGSSNVSIPILESLHKEHTILEVVTSPDAPIGRKQIMTPSPIALSAEQYSIPTVKPPKVKNNQEFLDHLKSIDADIFIVVSYGKILPAELLNIPRLKTVNIHFSLLPRYRGASPIQSALREGVTQTGTTIFVLDELVDHGPILAQRSLSINPDDTFISLAQKLSQMSAELLLTILPQYEFGTLHPIEQDHSNATFTTLINKDHGRILWSDSATDIYNQYRAFILWPGIWTQWENKKLKIIECTLHQKGEFDIQLPCGNNSDLYVQKLQLEGKNVMNAKDFRNGYPAFLSARLE